ncbi:MAG: putative metal-dependent hydrolase [Flavobacteriales bacterium]|nr:putative metal-dependent hydrolase [Flavobacteriales bacterium]
MDLQSLQYPVGKYIPNKHPDQALLHQWIKDIEAFPLQLEALVNDASVEALNWRYRPDGWRVKQVVHHCADSHLNSITRFKLAMTEDVPTIRPYYEDRWAELVDSQDDDLTASLAFLKALHHKWVGLLRGLSNEQLQLEYVHPEHGKQFNLAETIGSYAWHCRHHLEHVRNGIASGGKYG